MLKGHQNEYTFKSLVYGYIVNCPGSARGRGHGLDMQSLAIAEPFSLPPVKFLEDFAIKYQRSSIVMNLPKKISRNQLLKR